MSFARALFALVPEPEPEVAEERGRARRLPRLPSPAAGSSLEPDAHRERLPRGRHAPGAEELERALREAGARRGMAVEVGAESFEFVP